MGLQSVVGKLWYLKLIIALNLSADLASAQNGTYNNCYYLSIHYKKLFNKNSLTITLTTDENLCL